MMPPTFDPDGYLIEQDGRMRTSVMSHAIHLQANNDRLTWFLDQVRVAMEESNLDLREAIIHRALSRMDRTEPVEP